MAKESEFLGLLPESEFLDCVAQELAITNTPWFSHLSIRLIKSRLAVKELKGSLFVLFVCGLESLDQISQFSYQHANKSESALDSLEVWMRSLLQQIWIFFICWWKSYLKDVKFHYRRQMRLSDWSNLRSFSSSHHEWTELLLTSTWPMLITFTLPC